MYLWINGIVYNQGISHGAGISTVESLKVIVSWRNLGWFQYRHDVRQ